MASPKYSEKCYLYCLQENKKDDSYIIAAKSMPHLL